MYDLIIVGGGIAAFSAALFAGRRGLKVLVIGKDIGGQANSTDLIENYPGVVQTSGFGLAAAIKKQAEVWGVEFLQAEVTKISKVIQSRGRPSERGAPSFVVTAFGLQYKASAIVLAFGKTPRDLGVEGEEELKGKGVSYCGTCDVPLFKGKDVAVVGVGDINIDAALLASKFCRKVYVLSKTDKLIGHPALLKALAKKTNVELVSYVMIQRIAGVSSVTGLELTHLKTGKKIKLAISAVFVELGYIAASEFVKDIVDLDANGQIIVNADQATNTAGIFAAGDITNRPYKQAVISAGEAAAAALAAFDWLQKNRGGEGLSSDWTEVKRVK